MNTTVRVLDVLSVAALLGAGVLLVLPARATVSPTAIAVPDGIGATAPATSRDSTAALIVSGNLFSASRRAPSRAFVPPGMEGSTVEMSDGGAASRTDDVTMDPGMPATMDAGADESPQLFGIVMQDGERRALLQLPGVDAIPRLMAVGERRAGYRVVSIAPQSVVLASSSGTRTLRLVSRTPSDSPENLP